jgi:N-methylhydantoinase A
MKDNLRVAVDTGGTFTDIVSLDEETGHFEMAKSPTTPSNTMIGVLNAIDKLKIDLKKVDKFFIHGATTAINALIEKKGARTAYVGTFGFRDIPEIARYNRVEIFNPKYKKPPLLVPRRLRFEIKERMLVTGEVLVPLDVASVREVAKKIKASGVEAVAVCLHHAYKNSDHEQKVREIILKECPEVHVSISSEVAKEHREYERGLTTIIDSYIKPVVAVWIDELDAELKKRGLGTDLLLTRSDGGAMRSQMGKQSPVNTLLSGPAGGVMGGMFLAKKLKEPNIITMDMGGTSFDVSIIKDGEAKTSAETKAEEYELLIPNLDIRTIGAGGGSIGWIDRANALHVGPQSAGADPGPICYGKGGIEPTITDALMCTGYIDPHYFLGGDMSVDENLAEKGIQNKIGKPLSMDLQTAAAGMLNISFNHMVQAIRGITVERGDDPRDFSLLCYGGGGALFGSLISDELSMKASIIPHVPANFSAWGMLTVDVRHGFTETDIISLDKLTIKDINRNFNQLTKQGAGVLSEEKIPEKNRQMLKSLDMRYTGQEHFVNVIADFSLDKDFRTKIKKAFEKTYNSVFGYTLPQPIEVVNFRIAAVGRIPNPQLKALKGGTKDASAAQKGKRQVYDFVNRKPVEYKIYERSKLLAGNIIEGPALIEEPTTVTNTAKGSMCEIDKFGHLLITRKN